MKKVSWIVVIAGAVVGLAAVVLTHLGNPANMGFCIACFLRDITGAVGMHGAAKVQYVRPEIIGLVLGAFIMSVATKEFRAKAGSSPATRFVLGAFVMIGALAFLGCPLRMVLRIGGGDLNAVVGLVGFTLGIFIGIQFLKRGFSLKRAYPVGKGEGGVLPLDKTYVQAVAKLCAERDWLLLVDEVQSGVGRTGSLFAFQQYGVLPDVVSFAKGIAGGLPMSGIMANEKCRNVLGPGMHATTFGANPVCAAAGLVVQETLTDAFLEDVQAKGTYLRNRIEDMKLPCLGKTRGMGLMIGVEVKDGWTNKDLASKLIENGLLVLTAGPGLRLLPPLVISKEEMDAGLAIMEKTLR